MKKNPYIPFDRYVLRSPIFSFTQFELLSRKQTITHTALKEACSSPVFKESLFLASPDLYTAFEKWLETDDGGSDKDLKMRNTVLKYFSRMSARCTPFGLFAGTAVGQFSQDNRIAHDAKSPNRHTRLDMNYLVALALDIAKREDIKKQLKFSPNSSIYRMGGDLRYVEYSYINAMRQHHIMAVEETEYLLAVLDHSKSGAAYTELVELLIDDEITYEESKGFIDELIDSQLLVSELEPSVCGEEFTDQILHVLQGIPEATTIYKTIIQVQQTLSRLDQKIGNSVESYNEIARLLESLNVNFDRKFLFQTDLVHRPRENTLNLDIPNKVRRVMGFLNKITLPPETTPLSKFADAFYERYEHEEVSLSNLMDADLGLGFDLSSGHGDISAIVDDIALPYPPNGNNVQTEKTNTVDRIIIHKLKEIQKLQSSVLVLKDDDFKNQTIDWTDLPDTLSVMVQLVTVDGEDKIILGPLGGSSSANLLGRFCHGDAELHSLVSEIVDRETQMAHKNILAEIVHLPESRMGNILMRPSLRAYEIPFLAKSSLPKEQQLEIEDLVLRVSNRKEVILRSKKYNKRVLPRLTNAHNYSGRALPTYECLANLQHPKGRKGLGFSWPTSVQQEPFLPRVVYETFILSPKMWNIETKHLETLKMAKDDTAFAKALNQFIQGYKLPEYALLKEGDNELLIRWTNHSSVQMALDAIGNKSKFRLIEFLHSEPGIVRNGDDHYTNQVIMAFYNNYRLTNSILNDQHTT